MIENSIEEGKKRTSILKWSGRVVIGLALVDIIQSLFTGKTVTEHIHQYLSFFQAYAPDAIFLMGGTVNELRCRKLEKDAYELEQKVNSPQGILLKVYPNKNSE